MNRILIALALVTASSLAAGQVDPFLWGQDAPPTLYEWEQTGRPQNWETYQHQRWRDRNSDPLYQRELNDPHGIRRDTYRGIMGYDYYGR